MSASVVVGDDDKLMDGLEIGLQGSKKGLKGVCLINTLSHVNMSINGTLY